MHYHRIGPYWGSTPRKDRMYCCRSLALLFLASSALLGRPQQVHAQPENTGTQREVVLGIAYLNFDCYADTIQGFRTQSGYLPKRILWGIPQPDENGRLDSACLGRTPLSQRVSQTTISYAGSGDATGSMTSQQINADTLGDLVLHIHSRVTEYGIERDSLRSVVIFGQHGLDSLPEIRIGEISRFQMEPFFAMDLVKGSELINPAERDLSGRTSYELEPVDITLEDPDSMPPPMLSPLAGADYPGAVTGSARVQIYPNPARSAIMIDASGLRAGAYRIMLLSVNGMLELREEGRIEQGENLARTLDVRRVASGYYVVRIERAEGEAIATYPVIITR